MSYNWYSKNSNGWYKYQTSIFEDPNDLDEIFEEIIDWVTVNIDGAHKHCRWRMIMGPYCYHAEFMFRHERDYILFMLRWS